MPIMVALASDPLPLGDLKSTATSPTLRAMSTVKEIEAAITKLPLPEMESIRDWLDELIEDQLVVSDEFKAKIQRAKQEIETGVYSRVRQPEAGQ
jgi:hypothetical protein